MRFPKGQSGNPKGRPPKNEEMRSALRRALKEDGGKDAIARAIVREAAKGNVEAVKFVFDRIDGKVKDVVESQQTGEVIVRVIRDRAGGTAPLRPPPGTEADTG